MNFKKMLALVLALIMALSLVACGPKPAENTPADNADPAEKTYKEEIIIAMADEFTTIDPMETTAETNQIVQDCTHDLLTDTNLATMQNEGELVDSWEMVAPDHWKFKLKENVKFHDGTILNVDDVIFTFERAKDYPATANYVAMIAEFIKVDDLNFELKLTQGNVDFNYTLAANSLAILSKEAFETMDPAEAIKVGTGPWVFSEYVSGDHVTLTRFDDCTLYDVPNTQKLTFRMIPEASARMMALENGEVDVIMSPSATDYSRLSENEGLQLITETGRTQHFVGFNLENEGFVGQEQKFRLAMSKAINKDEMIIAAWDGYAQKSTSMMCRDMGFYADIAGIDYDPDGAKALFAELGITPETPMTIQLVTSDASHRTKMATNLQSQMAQYGINLEVEFMQNSALTELNTGDGKTSGVEMYIASWTPGKNADYMFRNPIHSDGGRNYSHLKNAEIDAKIDAAAGEMDESVRAQLYLELQEELTCEIIPWVPIAQNTLTFGAAEGVTGALIHPGLVHQFKMCERLI